jgi:hypothetical protein
LQIGKKLELEICPWIVKTWFFLYKKNSSEIMFFRKVWSGKVKLFLSERAEQELGKAA